MPKLRAKYRESEGCARQNAAKTKGKLHVKRMRAGKVWARLRCHDVARPHKRKTNQKGEPMRKGRSLVVGVVCGVVCVAGMMLYAHEIELNVEQERAEVLARYGSTQVEAYVATCDIAEGSKVDSTNVERRLMPGELLPEGAVTDLSQV